MKRIFSFGLVIFFVFTSAKFALAYGPNPQLLEKSDFIGQVQFGMDQKQIKGLKSPEDPLYEKQGNHYYLIVYEYMLGGLPCVQVYGFSENKLLYIYYEFPTGLSLSGLPPVKEYLSWLAALKSLYGQPAFVDSPWESDSAQLERDDQGKIGEYSWEEPTYILSLLLYTRGKKEASGDFKAGYIAIYLIDSKEVDVDS